jgi:hypothetical protein
MLGLAAYGSSEEESADERPSRPARLEVWLFSLPFGGLTTDRIIYLLIRHELQNQQRSLRRNRPLPMWWKYRDSR